MIYAKWAVLVLLTLAVDLLGLVAVAIALAFCKSESEHLPRLFWPWDNEIEGINGDGGWRGPEHANGHEREFWWRYQWLAIRNAGTNFSYLIGFEQTLDIVYIADTGSDPLTSNQGHEGTNCVRAFKPEGFAAWEYYYVKRWMPGRCLRVRLGWKLADNIDEETRVKNLGTRAQIVCSVNPVMTFQERAA